MSAKPRQNQFRRFFIMRLPTRRFFNDEEWDDVFRPLWQAERRGMGELMKTDILEKDGNYQLEIDMPGFDKKDISITVDNGYLTVSAKKDESLEKKDEKKNYIRKERRYGECSRSFYVGNIDEKSINASYDKGILNISFPKQSKQLPLKNQIEIK